MTYRAGTRGRVAEVGNAHVSRQISNTLAVGEDLVPLAMEGGRDVLEAAYLGYHAVALALVYPAAGAAGRDSASILASVLKIVETLVQVNRRLDMGRVGVGEDEPDDAAHFDDVR